MLSVGAVGRIGQGALHRTGGGTGGIADGSLFSATWETFYSDTVNTSAANGATVSGLPYGLTGTVSGGVLTVEGTPQ